MFDLDQAIKQWLRQFSRHNAFGHGSITEMEWHLRDHIDDLKTEGNTEEEAFDLAVREFGDVPEMAEEEYWNIKTKNTIMSLVQRRLFNNYFKTLIRGMIKHPMSAFINVFGLSVAVGICLIVYAFLVYDYSIDRFHKNENEVFLATIHADRDGTSQQYGLSPRPLGQMLSDDYAQVEKYCRMEDRHAIVKFRDQVFHEQVRFVDATFLEMFTFPLKWGLASDLEDKSSIILSEEMSIKYFGDSNPVGRDLIVKFDNKMTRTFSVKGVAEAFPDARTISFDFLINYELLQQIEPDHDMQDWGAFVSATLIQLRDPSEIGTIAAGMKKYQLLQNARDNQLQISGFTLEPLSTLRVNSAHIRNGIAHNYTAPGRVVLPTIALFMLALACFNYINIAIVSASKRLKEIGLRKVIGANRGLIIIQFLTENLLVTFFAIIIGLGLALTIFLPWFISLSGMQLTLDLLDINLWLFLIVVLFFTGLASGIYPALYISRFDVNTIFKGSVKFGKKNLMTRLLLGFQLVLACITMTGGVMFTQNATYQKERSWGYDPQSIIYLSVTGGESFNQLRDALQSNPNVLSITGAAHHLGKSVATTVISTNDRDYEVNQMAVDANYINTMGLEVVSGRGFMKNHEGDRQAVLINELMVKKLGLEQPIGAQFKVDSMRYEVIGVVKDFHVFNFVSRVKPLFMSYVNHEQLQFLAVKTRPEGKQQAMTEVQALWLAQFPETPFQGGYQEEVWTNFFNDVEVERIFMRAVAIISVILAALGLYGLVTLNITGRKREFSIKKVLGAGIGHIARNILKQYVLLVSIALAVAAPLSHVMMKANLDMLYAHPMPLSYDSVLFAMGLLILVIAFVIFSQVRKVSRANPAEGLNEE